MRLAKELGIPNVDRMLRGISGQAFAEWIAYSNLEPFGEERDDLRAGIIAATVANAMTRTKSSDPVHEAQDFMPRFGQADDEPAMNEEDAIAVLEAMFMGMVQKG